MTETMPAFTTKLAALAAATDNGARVYLDDHRYLAVIGQSLFVLSALNGGGFTWDRQ